jgi:hypothetical protein
LHSHPSNYYAIQQGQDALHPLFLVLDGRCDGANDGDSRFLGGGRRQKIGIEDVIHVMKDVRPVLLNQMFQSPVILRCERESHEVHVVKSWKSRNLDDWKEMHWETKV